jgi:hypothetical protein
MRMTVVSFAEKSQNSPSFIVANFRRFVKRKIAFFLKYCSIFRGRTISRAAETRLHLAVFCDRMIKKRKRGGKKDEIRIRR